MRVAILGAFLCAAGLLGCSGKPEMRPDPIDVSGTVKLPGGASPKDLTVTFQPRQNTPPGSVKLAADGAFSLKLTPGDYVVYFDETNSKLPGYTSIPESYRSPNEANIVKVAAGQPIAVTVK